MYAVSASCPSATSGQTTRGAARPSSRHAPSTPTAMPVEVTSHSGISLCGVVTASRVQSTELAGPSRATSASETTNPTAAAPAPPPSSHHAVAGLRSSRRPTHMPSSRGADHTITG